MQPEYLWFPSSPASDFDSDTDSLIPRGRCEGAGGGGGWGMWQVGGRSAAAQPFAKHFHFMLLLPSPLPLAVICRHFVGRSKMSCYFWPNMPHFYLCMLQPTVRPAPHPLIPPSCPFLPCPNPNPIQPHISLPSTTQLPSPSPSLPLPSLMYRLVALPLTCFNTLLRMYPYLYLYISFTTINARQVFAFHTW